MRSLLSGGAGNSGANSGRGVWRSCGGGFHAVSVVPRSAGVLHTPEERRKGRMGVNGQRPNPEPIAVIGSVLLATRCSAEVRQPSIGPFIPVMWALETVVSERNLDLNASPDPPPRRMPRKVTSQLYSGVRMHSAVTQVLSRPFEGENIPCNRASLLAPSELLMRLQSKTIT